MILNPDRYFSSKKDWVIVSVFAGSFLCLKIIAVGLLSIAGYFVDIAELVPVNERFSNYDERIVFSGLVIAPLFETLICQYLIIRGLLYIQPVKNYPAIAVAVSAIVFSIGHKNPHTVIFGAIVLAYNFYYFNKNSTGSFAYWSTVGLHFFYNLVTYISVYLIDLTLF